MITQAPEVELEPRRNRNRGAVLLVIVLIALAVGALFALLQAREKNVNDVQPIAPSVLEATTVAESSRWVAPLSLTPRPSTSVSAETSGFGYQPLWPFASVVEAQRWQNESAAGGHQPWHLDARQVALTFTQNYLGFTNVDTALQVRTWTRQAWVAVGFTNPNGAPVTSAELHLVRIGTGDDAPWEVVGTEDTTLTITGPGYGTQVSSPLQVEGRIFGVDESLRVEVRTQSEPHSLGTVSGISAGGEMSPWSASVPFVAPRGRTLTIVVATGGHIALVERFAITGVRY